MTLLATALRASWHGYNQTRLRADVLAGITIGLIAIPLAMALAIASGVPPQHGLYTAIIAGAVIAVCGGSRVNVSGPTAAFVVILLPITQQFGLSGLLLATMMSGVMLVFMGVSGVGKLVQFIPYPVTTGFTAGIAVVIASLQLKDLFGLHYTSNDAHFFSAVAATWQHLPNTHWPDLLLAVITLGIIVYWPKFKIAIPAYLVALTLVTVISAALSRWWPAFDVATIGSRFSYVVDGMVYNGIPTHLPQLQWPWHYDELPLTLATLKTLSGPAFAIALLGAIESLLCAVVSDGLSGYRHHSNGELVGQGLGNIIAPLFGGITATAAIARTAANVRAGATSPLAAFIHSLTVLCALVLLAPLLAYMPMAALAALLIMVAWNMSDAAEFVQVVRTAPRADVFVLLTCFALTVVFDMVIAVEIGVVLAALLFIKRMAELSETTVSTRDYCQLHGPVPDHVVIYDIRGPLFFGAAEKAMQALWRVDHGIKHVVFNLEEVPMMDLSGIVALRTTMMNLDKHQVQVSLCGVNDRIAQKLRKAQIDQLPNVTHCHTIAEALALPLDSKT